MLDRILASWVALARGAQANIDYMALYRARVLRQSVNRHRLDVRPEDPRLPPMADVPLKLGVPGVEATIPPGHFVIVGWENGRPNRPYATLWNSGEGTPIKLTINGVLIELGGTTSFTDGVMTGQSVDTVTGLQQWMMGNGSSRVRARKA